MKSTSDSGASWTARAQLVDLRTLYELGDAPCSFVDDVSISPELSPRDAHRLLLDARQDPAMKDVNVLVTTTLPDPLALGETCDALAEANAAGGVLSITDVFPEKAAAIESDLARRMADPKTLEVMRQFGARAPGSRLPDELNDPPLEELLGGLAPGPERWPPPAGARSDSGPYRLRSPYVAHEHRDVGSIHWDFPLVGNGERMHLVVVKGEPALVPAKLGTPLPPQAIRLLRSWNVRFGAEAVFVGHDTIEMFVPRRPLEIVEIKDVVREQMAFAPDLGQTDDWVIASLTNVLGHRWSFWFD